MNSTILSREDKLKILEERKVQAAVKPEAFINFFCKTFDPKRAPHHLKFKLFDFQEELVAEVKKAIDEGYDIFIEKSREMGATYTVLDVLLWFWLYIPGSNFLLGSRKEAYVDNTKGESGDNSNKEESLFGKIEYTLNRLPKFMLPKGFDFRKHMTYMSLINPENGNVISGESSNPHFSRGGRHKAIMMDEFAFWDNDTSAWGSTADTTDCRIVVTTPGIRPGKAKRLRFGSDGEHIKVITLHFTKDPRKNAEWVTRERSRRSAEDFAREIEINWETSVQGRVYPEIQFATVGNFPYNAQWPLYVSWDFGLDGMALQWWQKNKINGKWRLVEAYENSDKIIDYFFPFFPGCMIDSKFEYISEDIGVIDKTKEFKKAIHFGDPDVAKRSIQTGLSTRKVLENIGIYVQTKPEANHFHMRKEQTKRMLQNGIEINKTRGTDQWMECMKNARFPQRGESSEAVTPINLPVHDWTSHHRTSTEYFAINSASGQAAGDDDPYKKYEKHKQDDYNPIA